MDSPAAKAAAQDAKLRAAILATARETVRAACSSLLDRLIEANCQGSMPEIVAIRKEAMIHMLKHVSLHDILIKKDV